MLTLLNRKTFGFSWVLVFIGTIFGANWAIETYGIIPVGFGLMAPAGVYFVGLAFTARDFIHETLGRWPVIAAILVGAALSWWVAPTFAIASGVAFLVSEAADYAVYSPLRRRGWLRAVTASNVVGLVADSALFLWLAFGSLDFLSGQIVAKGYMTIAAIVVLAAWRARGAILPRHASA